MRKLLAIAALLGITTFWACHLGPEDKSDNFDIAGDTAWTHCDTLEILLLDDTGKVLDTLFHDSLVSLSQLANLSADKYPGGTAKLSIKGYYKSGAVCVDQVRTFQDGGTHVVVDTVKDPSASPTSITALPESLSLVLGGPAVAVKGTVQPSYADQGLRWSMDSGGIASLDVAADSVVQVVKVKAEAIGTGFLTLRSRKDGSKFARVKIRVAAAAANSVTLDNDSLSLFVNGPRDSLAAVVTPFQADPRVSWSSASPEIAAVDSAGRITPGKAGRTYVTARAGNGKSDSALIIVAADVPRLTVSSKAGAPVNVPIIFSPVATQKVGHLVLYAWDLQGDGSWDDSLAGPWFGDSINLPAVSGKYAAEGAVKPKFRIRDSEGNTAITEVTVDIGNQAPEIVAIRADTSISIKDSIAMTATAKDLDGRVAWVGWDYEGDGRYDDTLATADSLVEVVLGHRYQEAGNYLAIFKAVDGNGKVRLDTARVKVESDPPVADAGNDTTVLVNGDIHLSIKGTDKYGPIVKRELKIGTGPFLNVSKQDTVLKAPSEPTLLTLVIRVTDNDGLTAQDTVQVTVILSADADLSNLVFSAGDLVPVFRSATGTYTARVAFKDSLVRVTPTAKDGAANITVNQKVTASGSASEPVKLLVGSNLNAFQIIVTAPDGSQRVYTLSIARDPNAEATLKSLVGTGFTLKPAFAATVLEYRDTVGYSVSSITLRPTVASIGATVAVNDTAIASGTPTGALPLQYGENLFTVTVTAMDGNSRTSYVIRIVRLSKLYIYKKLGAAAAILADSAELPIGTPRAISSPGSVGYRFAKWTLLEGAADLADSSSNPTDLTVRAGLVKAQAVFDNLRYTVAGSTSGCGELNPPGTVTLDHGQSVVYGIKPLVGCRIVSVKIDGVEDTTAHDGSFTFGNVTSNRTIAATFIRTYTMTGIAGSGGGITPTKAVVDSGTDQTFTITLQEGKRISSFKVDGVAETPATTRTFAKVSADHTVEATFVAGYALTASVASGSGSITPADTTVDSLGTVTFKFKPSPGYRLAGITDNKNEVKPTGGDSLYALSGINSKHDVQVRFIRQYEVVVTYSGPGTVTGGPTGTVNAGSTSTFTISPTPGSLAFIGSMVANGVSINPPTGTHSFAGIDRNCTLSVVFVNRFRIPTTWGTSGNNHVGGSISPENPAVDSGSDQTVSLSTKENYRLSALTIDGASAPLTTTSHTFTGVTAQNRSMVATFLRTFQVTAVSAGGGTITPASATVDTLGSVTLKYPAFSGYRFARLRCNGLTLKAESDSITLSSVNEAKACSVYFQRQYTVSGSVIGDVGGTISPTLQVLNAGSTQVVTMSPTPENKGLGYRVLAAYDGESQVPTTGLGIYGDQSYTLSDINADHKMQVQFQRYFAVTGGPLESGGTVEPSAAKIDDGNPHTVTIKPNAGFALVELRVNGTPVEFSGLTYTFPKVGEPYDVRAVFKETPTFPLVLKDSIVLGKEETGPKIPPNLCVTWESQFGGGTYCNEGLVDMNIPSGSKVTIQAAKSVTVCQFGCEERPFTFWYVRSLRGGGTTVKDNPVSFEMTSSLNLKAVYGGSVIAPASVEP